MEMVVLNLLDNALKYSEDAVEVRLVDERLCIVDRGVGIEPEALARVTEKFYRAQKHGWDHSMGLGLAIVAYILELHGVTLRIDSEPGVGTRVCFELPKEVGK